MQFLMRKSLECPLMNRLYAPRSASGLTALHISCMRLLARCLRRKHLL